MADAISMELHTFNNSNSSQIGGSSEKAKRIKLLSRKIEGNSYAANFYIHKI
jgi:hypothetical protein